jgi:exopolysaccharide biosynthesis polyprenyl glycosylphosphotransferase
VTSAVPERHRVEAGRRAVVGPPLAGGRHASALLAAVDLLAGTAVVLAVLGVADTWPPPAQLLVAVLAWGTALAAFGAWGRTPGTVGVRPVLRAGIALALASWVAGGALAPDLAHGTEIGVVAALVLTATATRLVVGSQPVRVTVIGDLADLTALTTEMRRDRRHRWQVAATCVAPDERMALSGNIDPELRSTPMWLGTESVVEAARATGSNAVVIVPGRGLDAAAVRRASWAAHEAGVDVFVGTGLLDVVPSRVEHLSAGALGLARVRPRTGPSKARAAKGLSDRVIAGLALLAVLPLMLVIAAAIRLDSAGGALYAQRRTGQGGRTFTMYKFRTMRTDAEQRRDVLADRNDCDAVLFKMRADPRITRVGGILRRYSLDELPQLINIVRGEMSLVGPRPALPAEVAQYTQDPQHRLVAKPGLTGLWQVSGRSDLSWDESVRLDLHYVDNWSWALDLQILARTVRAVIGHRGAY